MLLMIIMFLLMFTAIVVAHEWGHYMTAKKNGVLVHEFAIGMGPAIWSKKIGETQYSIRILPIGGYCRMEEEIGESQNPRAMASKKPWQKLMILSAGAIMNFVLAWLLFTIIATYYGTGSTVINEVQPNTPAAEVNLESGDKILGINGHAIKKFSELQDYLSDKPSNYTLTIDRKGEKLDIPISTKIIGKEKNPRFGFTVKIVHWNIWDNVKRGFLTMVATILLVWDSVIQLISGMIGLDQMAGFVGIINAGSQVWDSSMQSGGVHLAVMNMIYMAGLLSANLGVMNLLPFPALDGGRILFILIEIIRGKAVPPEKEGAVHLIGMVLLMLLTVVVLYNDIRRII